MDSSQQPKDSMMQYRDKIPHKDGFQSTQKVTYTAPSSTAKPQESEAATIDCIANHELYPTPHQMFRRGRRPALIPHSSSLTLAEADDLVRARTGQSLLPPPDPQLLKQISKCIASETGNGTNTMLQMSKENKKKGST